MMQFHWQGEKVVLRGDLTLERSQITLKPMMNELCREGGDIFLGVGTKELRKEDNFQEEWYRRYRTYLNNTLMCSKCPIAFPFEK